MKGIFCRESTPCMARAFWLNLGPFRADPVGHIRNGTKRARWNENGCEEELPDRRPQYTGVMAAFPHTRGVRRRIRQHDRRPGRRHIFRLRPLRRDRSGVRQREGTREEARRAGIRHHHGRRPRGDGGGEQGGAGGGRHVDRPQYRPALRAGSPIPTSTSSSTSGTFSSARSYS